MFPDAAALTEAAPDTDTELEVLQSSMVWTMERETGGRADRAR